MSEDIVIVAESADKANPQTAEAAVSGHFFARALPDFDEIAEMVGTRRISEFAHYDPDIADDIAEHADQYKLDPKWADRATYDQWHDPSDGLVCLRTIRSFLEQHPEFVAERFRFVPGDLRRPRIRPSELMDELQEFENELVSLEQRKVRFRFEVG